MPAIDFYKYNRFSLNREQRDFLSILIPLAKRVQEWTKLKSDFIGIECPRGVLASILIADSINTSDYGSHPIADSEIKNKYSNNLFMLEAGEQWKGRINEWEGKSYRAYKSCEEAAVDLSDYFVFSRLFDLVLVCRREELQIQALSMTKPNYKEWAEATTNTINFLNLTEFDF